MNELKLKFSQINSKIDLVVLQLWIIGGADDQSLALLCKAFLLNKGQARLSICEMRKPWASCAAECRLCCTPLPDWPVSTANNSVHWFVQKVASQKSRWFQDNFPSPAQIQNSVSRYSGQVLFSLCSGVISIKKGDRSRLCKSFWLILPFEGNDVVEIRCVNTFLVSHYKTRFS